MSLKEGGNPIFVPTNPHGPFSEFKKIGFKRSHGHGHFGPINKCLEALILGTGFRYPYLLALNGRNFGINAHLVANSIPHHRLKGPKPEGCMI